MQTALTKASTRFGFLAVLSTAILTVLPAEQSFAGTAGLNSTYTDVDGCGTLEEGDDQFTLKCKGPGGASAILQYVEGRVGLLFLPSMQGHQLSEADLIPISPSAGKVFPGKLEWRSKAGSRKPCAAVIRVPAASGKALQVFDLIAGKHAGSASGNDGARRIADAICQGDQAAAAAPVSAGAAEPAPASADDAQIHQAVMEAQGLFQSAYLETGISGVSEAVDSCYQAAGNATDVARCAQLDLLGKRNDEAFAAQFNMPTYKYFRAKNVDRRFKAAVKRLGLERSVSTRIKNALIA